MDKGSVILLITFVVVLALVILYLVKKEHDTTIILFQGQLSMCHKIMAQLTRESSVSSFFNTLAQLNQNTATLETYRSKFKDRDSGSTDALNDYRSKYTSLQRDLQWLLRDAIERQSKEAGKAIRNLYRNSNEHQVGVYQSFCNEMLHFDAYFSPETREFTANCADKLFQSLNQHSTLPRLYPRTDTDEYYPETRTERESFESIDNMDGHEFEHWCASLLSQNGFKNVRVTPGSGDQGVDVLAEKDGIRYAIQCKCYSSSLGNKPIQEVYAGKAVYNCHVGVVMTNSSFTPGAVEAAKQTNTLLWDRNKLRQMYGTRR